MPLVFSVCFRNGDVGGDRGFEAAAAFLMGDVAESCDGWRMKTRMTIHNTTPTIIVSGLVRRNDRTGPMPSSVGCPQSKGVPTLGSHVLTQASVRILR